MAFVNYELLPFAAQVRLRLNNEFNIAYTISTAATGVFTPVWTSGPMPTGSAWAVDAKALAVAAGSGAGGARVDLVGIALRGSGNASILGSAVVINTGSSVNFNLALVALGQGIQVQVKDDATVPMDWTVHIMLREAK